MPDAPPGYRCPGCGSWVPPDAAWRPFCSERCKQLDLGHWLAGRYKIPARDDDEDAGDLPRGPAPTGPGPDDHPDR